jgi:signal transduction histidine kinase
MGRLVDDMLMLARADAGVLQSQPEPTDVDVLVRELVADVAGRAHAEYHVVGTGHLAGGIALVDPAQLRQLVLILVDNALVHTPDGTQVEVTAVRRGGELVVAVADSGPGIPPEEREKVFERFRRNIAGRPSGGAGLGLAIARELAVRAGGTVRLGDNRPGLRAEVVLPATGGVGTPDRGWRVWRRWLPLGRALAR